MEHVRLSVCLGPIGFRHRDVLRAPEHRQIAYAMHVPGWNWAGSQSNEWNRQKWRNAAARA